MIRLSFALLLIATVAAHAEQRLSASDLLPPELKQQQADDGANPGMLWVQRGQDLWTIPGGKQGKSCAGCHGDATATMRGVAARYPAIDGVSGRLVNLEGRINDCRERHMDAEPLTYESDDMLGLTAFITRESRGLPFSVRIDGPARPHYDAGRRFFFQRQGQLNLACNQCHDDNVGRHLRGDTISSGLPTGYPVYRLDWQKMGSLHRRLRACALGVRAEQLDYGSPEYIDLELYLAARAGSVAIDAPALRK